MSLNATVKHYSEILINTPVFIAALQPKGRKNPNGHQHEWIHEMYYTHKQRGISHP